MRAVVEVPIEWVQRREMPAAKVVVMAPAEPLIRIGKRSTF
jgi:hypothetical protein